MKASNSILLLGLLGIASTLSAAGRPTPRVAEDAPVAEKIQKVSPAVVVKEDESVAAFRSRAKLLLHFIETLKSHPHINLGEESVDRIKVALKYTRILKAEKSAIQDAIGNQDAQVVLPVAVPIKDDQPEREGFMAILVNDDNVTDCLKSQRNFDSEVVDTYRKVAGLSSKFRMDAKPLIHLMVVAKQNHLGQPDVRGEK